MLPLEEEINMLKSHENRAEGWVPAQGRLNEQSLAKKYKL